jgi:hypothetical protein
MTNPAEIRASLAQPCHLWKPHQAAIYRLHATQAAWILAPTTGIAQSAVLIGSQPDVKKADPMGLPFLLCLLRQSAS